MAKRKFLLAIGQSNSTAIGDAQSWEDNNPLIRLRSPQATPSQVSQGSYSDYFTMPSTFPGGPQTGRFGEGPKRGAWQSFDLKGLAAQNVKMLTFYDPIASYFNLGSGYTIRYPGTCTTLAGCTQDTLVSTAYWQYDPSGLKVTRKKTGIEHTLSVSAFSGLTNQAKVTPAMIPPPEPGEDFTYEIRLESSDTGKLRFTNMFGGLSDLGMALEAADKTARFGNVLNVNGAPIKAVMKYTAKPLPDNASIQFKRFLGLGDWASGAQPGAAFTSKAVVRFTNENGNLLVTRYSGGSPDVHGFNDGDKIRFGSAGTLPTGVNNTTTYFVVNATSRTFQVATTAGGTPITYTNAGTPPSANDHDVRRGIRIGYLTTTPYATPNKVRVLSYLYFPNGAGGGDQVADSWEWETNQPIAFNRVGSGALPTAINQLGTTYYIRDLDRIGSGDYRFSLAATPGGTAITFTGGTDPSALGIDVVHAPEPLYVSRKLKAEATFAATITIIPSVLFAFASTAPQGITEYERVRFSTLLPIPAGFTAGKDYFIKRKTVASENDGLFELSEYPGGPSLQYSGSGLVAFERVDLPYMYELTNTIGSTGYVLPSSSGAVGVNTQSFRDGEVTTQFATQASFGMRVLETWRGSLSGVKLRSIGGSNNGQSVTLGDITYELVGGQYRSTVSYTGSFTAALSNLDKFVMEPPMVGGVTTPWHKWAYWLPWSPFEGRSYANSTQAGTLTASAGGPITYNGFFGEPLAKNTAIKFDSQSRKVRIDSVTTDGKLITINGPISVLSGSTTTQIQINPGIAEVGSAIEFVTGDPAIVGQRRNVTQDTPLGGTTIFTEAFPVAPQAGDTFNVYTSNRPTDFFQIDTTPVLAYGEPAQGWIGRTIRFLTGALANQQRTIIFCMPDKIRVNSAFTAAPSPGDRFEIVEDGVPSPMVDGKTYYVATCTSTALTFSATYNGPVVTSPTGITTSGVVAVQYDQENKYNPYPPGFNYPNHYTPVAGVYQPYDGYKASPLQPKQGHYVGLGSRLYDYFGETMHVIPFAVGATGITHSELNIFGSDQGTGHAWHDPDQQLSWAPGEPNNCYARLMDVLDSAKNAFAANGDTGECVGIVWLQGENDAYDLDSTQRYAKNCTTLKNSIRAAIKERGLFSGSAHKIPWIHPKIREATGWNYGAEINAAIDSMVEADSYSRTFAVEDVTVMPDNVHYTGAGMHLIATRAYDALLEIYRLGTSEVDICNLALANIGETAKVTSIDPPDGSAQASLCATFYPLARDSLLQMGTWSFAIKRKALVEVDNPRTEWEYAYAVPADASGIIAVTPPDASNDYIEYGMDVPQKFVVETDIYGKRVLYTNQKDAHARYNAKIVDTTLFSTIFTIALSWHLASMLAGPIIKGDVGAAESKRCAQVASAYMMQAKTHDTTTQAEIKPPHTPSWINWR